MKLRTSFRWLAGVALSGLVVIALAAGNAADLLKGVTELRASLTKAAQDKAKTDGSRIDYVSIANQVKAKAEEAVKDVDPSKVEASESLEWAQLFSMAGRHKDTQTALNVYLGTKPEGLRLYQAQSMMLSAAGQTKDTKTMAATLKAIQPYDMPSTLGWVSIQLTYAPRCVDQFGVDGTVAMIDAALDKLSKTEVNDQLKARVSSLQSMGLQSKIDLYKDAGKKDKVLKLLDEAIEKAPPEGKSRFVTLKNQMNLVGAPAPTLTIERGYGDFPGLAALKGKVVIMDFFAHWCGPCKAAFPDMRQMYADLKPKGLEIVGVTTYYGYVGDPKVKLTPDEEYAKMKDFVKDQNMTWPIVFGARDNFAAYGVTAIPHVVVVGRDGSVHKLEIGYTPEIFAKFRKEVEALLAER